MKPKLLLALLLALPGPLGAQAGPTHSEEPRARATATILFKASQISDRGRIHLGGWAGLVLGNHFALGGGGLALLEAVELSGTEAGTGFDLRMGYGGIVGRWWEPLPAGLTGEAGLLLGAGHGEVTDRLTGRELGADNFLVGEPEVGFSFSPFPGLHGGASVGYRMVWGVGDLPRVSEKDLRAWTWTLFVRVGAR